MSCHVICQKKTLSIYICTLVYLWHIFTRFFKVLHDMKTHTHTYIYIYIFHFKDTPDIRMLDYYS